VVETADVDSGDKGLALTLVAICIEAVLNLRRTSFLLNADGKVTSERRQNQGTRRQSRLARGVTPSGCFCGMYCLTGFRRVAFRHSWHGPIATRLIQIVQTPSQGVATRSAQQRAKKGGAAILCPRAGGGDEHHRRGGLHANMHHDLL